MEISTFFRLVFIKSSSGYLLHDFLVRTYIECAYTILYNNIGNDSFTSFYIFSVWVYYNSLKLRWTISTIKISTFTYSMMLHSSFHDNNLKIIFTLIVNKLYNKSSHLLYSSNRLTQYNDKHKKTITKEIILVSFTLPCLAILLQRECPRVCPRIVISSKEYWKHPLPPHLPCLLTSFYIIDLNIFVL